MEPATPGASCDVRLTLWSVDVPGLVKFLLFIFRFLASFFDLGSFAGVCASGRLCCRVEVGGSGVIWGIIDGSVINAK